MRLRRPFAPRLRSTAYPVLLLSTLAATAGVSYVEPGLESSRVEASSDLDATSASTLVTSNEVYLPIEVMGPGGVTRSVSIYVENPVGVDSMYLVGHALGYQMGERLWNGVVQRDGKASYRINGGAWQPVSNAAAHVRWPEREYLGIGGAYHTVRLTVPVSGIQSGPNTIEFRFNGTEGASSGYRILELDLRAGGVSRIEGTAFVQDDPAWWSAPAGADPARGQVAWERRNALRESALPGAPTIIASCSDCHAYSGYDLKYFNFSNASIEARAEYHGLTAQEGRDIAAYIRNVNLGRSDGQAVSPYARPWNPPYQPGPGLTARGEEDWAAGAGIDWVLDSDDETAYYVFPDATGQTPNPNPSPDDMARAVRVGSWDEQEAGNAGSFGQRIDIQNIPIALQYPDWNNWLPDIHPLDAIGYADLTSTDLWAAHLEMYTRYDTPQKVAEVVQRDRDFITCTSGCGASGFADLMFRIDYELDEWPDRGMFDISYATDPARYHLGRLSFMQWESVKTWEVMNLYRLQDLGDELFEGLTTPSPWIFAGQPLRLAGSRPEQDPPFFWPGGQSIIFDLAPHKNADPGFPTEGPYGPPGTDILQYYYSTVWYDLQLVLSRELAGWPGNNGGAPIDWNYQTALAISTQVNTDVSQWWRMFRARAVASQTRNNYYAQATTSDQYAFNGGPGFSSTNANYWEVLWMYPQANGTGGSNHLAGDIALTRRALQEYWDQWFSFARTVPVESWQRNPGPVGSCCGYQPAAIAPQGYTGGVQFGPYDDADNAYRLPALMQAWGMDPDVIDGVARWGESMWPLGDFEQWFSEVDVEDLPGPAEGSPLVQLGQTSPNPFSSSVTIPYDLSRPALVQVQIYDSIGRLVATVVDEHQEAGAYAPVFESPTLPGGLYLCRVRADGVSATRTMVLAR